MTGRPDDFQFHHIGGHLYGRLGVQVRADVHDTTLKQTQVPYIHLLRRPNLPVSIGVAIVLLDVAALLELVGREVRRLAHLLLEPYTLTPAGRRLLRHPRVGKERPDE